MSENSQNDLPKIFEDFRKFSEIFGSARKCSENFGNPRKIFECIWRFTKIFITFQYLTPMDWRSDSRILICNLHRYYAFCTGITLFALVLLFNCTALSQSESSNFFMYVIMRKIKILKNPRWQSIWRTCCETTVPLQQFLIKTWLLLCKVSR